MLKRREALHPGFVAIGKTRTLIWKNIDKGHKKPYVMYDPISRPSFHSVTGPRSTSNYEFKDTRPGARTKFHLLAGWMKPGLDEQYCDNIWDHIRDFDRVYLVGGGKGRWSGINCFMEYLEEYHPDFVVQVTPERHFRLTDYPEYRLMEIFKRLSQSE